MSSDSRPPRWAEALLGLLLPWQYRDEHLGDLEEGFQRRATDPVGARMWYLRQVVRSVPGAVRLRLQTRKDPSTTDTRMEMLGQDLRYALRSLIKNPGFAIVATVTLALAIGVNTSIFSLVNVIVFADLPMQESDDVVLIRGVNPELEIDQGSVSPADYLDLVERSESFEALSALTEAGWILTGGDQPERISGVVVSPGLFAAWKLPPILGREFIEGEDREGSNRVAMLTHGYWQERYSGDPDVLGETITLDGLDITIVGVADPKFEFASFRTTQVIMPLVLNRAEPNRTVRYLFVSGRIAPGTTHEIATQEVHQISLDLADEHPEQNRGWTLWSAPVMESLIDDDGNTVLLMLQLTVGMVILIACANVANMLLARATARAREIAVRAALGAGRRRLIRQLLTESLVISIAAGALGLAFAWALNRGLILISAGTEEVFMMAELDRRVLAFTLLVSLVAPLAFGLVPALRTSAASASGTLRESRSTDGGRSGKRARGALVTAQVSLALTLMIVASLVARSVVNIHTRPLGFDAADVLTVAVDLPEVGYEEPEAREQFYTLARDALRGIPGFSSVEVASSLPGIMFGARRSLEIEGVETPEGRAAPNALFYTVSDGFFNTLGLEMQRGRGFMETDNADSFDVVVVSRELADRFWPDQDPIGRRVRVAEADSWMQVIGVVADVRALGDMERPAPNMYIPHAQDSRAGMYLLARTGREAGAVAGEIRRAVWSVDPQLPVGPIRTVERAQYEFAASDLAIMSLFVTFALFALIMAAVGIYGVMAYAVSQRRAEIGLRMALGAEVAAVRWMVLRQGMKLLALGTVLGLAVAFVLSRLISNLVFGISPTDPLSFIGVPVVMALVALVANLVPAGRATRTDPATTLRAE